MQLWKGAGPGTYWHANDAKATGFLCPAATGPSPNAAVRHITQASYPSPFTSFSTSYAVAYDYATLGGAGKGYVYEIETIHDPTMQIHDPIAFIASLPSPPFTHGHDGPPGLIAGIALPGVSGAVLSTPPKRFGLLAGSLSGPSFSNELRALVNAIRDAELLLERVPAICIIGRHAVP
jgi:hypothetical protein